MCITIDFYSLQMIFSIAPFQREIITMSLHRPRVLLSAPLTSITSRIQEIFRGQVMNIRLTHNSICLYRIFRRLIPVLGQHETYP